MQTDFLENQWKLLLVKAQTVWTDLSEEDLKKAEAGVEKLADALEAKYGKTKEEAQALVQDFLNKFKDLVVEKPKA